MSLTGKLTMSSQATKLAVRKIKRLDYRVMSSTKRSSSFEAHSERQKPSKGGRKQMRTIRKASPKQKDDDLVEDKHDSEQNEAKDDFSTEIISRDPREEPEKTSDQGEAYAALLTLLKAEHGSKRSVPKKSEKEAEAGSEDDAQDLEPEHGEEYEESEEAAIEHGLSNEKEEDEENEAEGIEDGSMEDEEDKADPLEKHFNSVSEKNIDELDAAFKSRTIRYRSTKLPVDQSQEFIYSRPTLPNDSLVAPPTRSQSLDSYFIKQRLKIQNDLMDSNGDKLTPLQKQILDPVFQYQDLLYEYDNYNKESEYRDLYTLHVLNHIYKTRDRILKNNQRLQDNPDQELLDQGFTRPKVLIVVPTRDVAHQVLTKIIEKSGIDQVDKKGKFKDQFYQNSTTPSYKPKSFKHVFQGNTNDFFVIGAKFTRKAIKLYSNFYQSDIIICSPLGIQLILENTDKKKRQDDFLSSIELLVIDQLHSIEFQNVLHLSSIFEHLNKIPQQQHDADFSRIKMWYINDQAKLLRQTLIFTRHSSPFANSLINGKCKNYAGRWKNHSIVSSDKSSLGQLGMRTRLVFQRFDLAGNSAIDEPDYRFKHFCSVIVPNIVKSTGYEDGILLYIPDYTDFIRVRNYMREKTSILFGDINEYSEQRQLNANRSLFQQGRIKVMLYTERLHHFRRYEIKGVKTVIFYKPPSNPEFFEETVRYLGKSAFLGVADLNISVVRCLYSKLDGLALEKIVGTERAAVLTRGPNETYEFK
ncbi:LANO_0H06414g1_1 [Lachancea nothofagi CBS 11611]|uniref:U3 small nucleolar RNA-associated protein 25 n=1 Tax=Lachancea nothofagi CBS 11611 TaxID=1266666 RepID=A0A1G4KLN1_9SACH|nr:LANO_0H06414g1_1 [Lachancea nothofagi CBS 11611]